MSELLRGKKEETKLNKKLTLVRLKTKTYQNSQRTLTTILYICLYCETGTQNNIRNFFFFFLNQYI